MADIGGTGCGRERPEAPQPRQSFRRGGRGRRPHWGQGPARSSGWTSSYYQGLSTGAGAQPVPKLATQWAWVFLERRRLAKCHFHWCLRLLVEGLGQRPASPPPHPCHIQGTPAAHGERGSKTGGGPLTPARWGPRRCCRPGEPSSSRSGADGPACSVQACSGPAARRSFSRWENTACSPCHVPWGPQLWNQKWFAKMSVGALGEVTAACLRG